MEWLFVVVDELYQKGISLPYLYWLFDFITAEWLDGSNQLTYEVTEGND